MGNMLFPFHMVERGSDIILYGAGDVGLNYFHQLQKSGYCKITHWIDRDAERFPPDLGIEDIHILDRIKNYDYLVIAIRKPELLNSVYKCLDGYGIEKERIVWWDPLIDIKADYKKRLSINNILKDCMDKEQASKIGKIKVRFFYTANYWNNSLQSVVKAFSKDKMFDVLVIGLRERKEIYLENSVKYINTEKYMLWRDRPDIVFLTGWEFYRRDIFKGLYKYTKLIVGLHFSLIKWHESFSSHIQRVEKEMSFAGNPDFFLYDKYIYEGLCKEGISVNKRFMFGNPKYDVLFEKLKGDDRPQYPEEWGKLKGKKVFLYAPDHVVFANNVTFDLYAQKIFAYMDSHQNAALIVRLHPTYIKELLKADIWTSGDIQLLKDYCTNSHNIIWDDLPTYHEAYSIADVIMTDPNCGIIISALVLDKPIVIMHRYDRPAKSFASEYTDELYNVYSIRECEETLDALLRGEDKTKAARDKWMPKLIAHYDGHNGERIKEFVSKKYEEKYKG